MDTYLQDLEMMVDDTSFSEVVEMLATIAHEKADHVAGNYQDWALVRHLRDIATKLNHLDLCE